MTKNKWQKLGWEHPVWELVRFYLSLRKKQEKEDFIRILQQKNAAAIGNQQIPLEADTVSALLQYLEFRKTICHSVEAQLRTEEEATQFCVERFNKRPETTRTQSRDHYQSSKSLVMATSLLAAEVCRANGVTLNQNPETRCVWVGGGYLHVTARRLDGAITSLVNPWLVWEIKEYWGGGAGKEGGSKMSDAVYECALVGRELRDFEKRKKIHIEHAVLLDGREQWNNRKSDLWRICDLFYQGLIDALFVGKEVETAWPQYVNSVIARYKSDPELRLF